MLSPALDLCDATIQLLLELPSFGVHHAGSGYLKLLGVILATFTLTSNLPTGAGVAQALPLTSARTLRAVTDRRLLPRLLLLLEREASQPSWHRNSVLCVGVALMWALGAAVPLSTLFDPSVSPHYPFLPPCIAICPLESLHPRCPACHTVDPCGLLCHFLLVFFKFKKPVEIASSCFSV